MSKAKRNIAGMVGCPVCLRFWLMELGQIWFDDEVCPDCDL